MGFPNLRRFIGRVNLDDSQVCNERGTTLDPARLARMAVHVRQYYLVLLSLARKSL
jgi:hypothetical protein